MWPVPATLRTRPHTSPPIERWACQFNSNGVARFGANHVGRHRRITATPHTPRSGLRVEAQPARRDRCRRAAHPLEDDTSEMITVEEHSDVVLDGDQLLGSATSKVTESGQHEQRATPTISRPDMVDLVTERSKGERSRCHRDFWSSSKRGPARRPTGPSSCRHESAGRRRAGHHRLVRLPGRAEHVPHLDAFNSEEEPPDAPAGQGAPRHRGPWRRTLRHATHHHPQ